MQTIFFRKRPFKIRFDSRFRNININYIQNMWDFSFISMIELFPIAYNLRWMFFPYYASAYRLVYRVGETDKWISGNISSLLLMKFLGYRLWYFENNFRIAIFRCQRLIKFPQWKHQIVQNTRKIDEKYQIVSVRAVYLSHPISLRTLQSSHFVISFQLMIWNLPFSFDADKS